MMKINYMKIIFELTLAERSFLQENPGSPIKFIRPIHIISSMVLAGRTESEVMSYIDDFFTKDVCDGQLYTHFLRRINQTVNTTPSQNAKNPPDVELE